MTIKNGDVSLNVAVQGEGPLILMIHGWPELWYSWRHQISHFAGLGYKVAAMDVRGYGASSKPHELKDHREAFIKPPAFFIGGERDTVRHFVPGMDLYDMAGAACEDFRGSVVIPGAGHWIQQEAPEATTAALENFVKEL
ncbi:MAG: alpha/beta hydrolase [Pseudomonadota bacterium]